MSSLRNRSPISHVFFGVLDLLIYIYISLLRGWRRRRREERTARNDPEQGERDAPARGKRDGGRQRRMSLAELAKSVDAGSKAGGSEERRKENDYAEEPAATTTMRNGGGRFFVALPPERERVKDVDPAEEEEGDEFEVTPR